MEQDLKIIETALEVAQARGSYDLKSATSIHLSWGRIKASLSQESEKDSSLIKFNEDDKAGVKLKDK